jgi:O-acetylhomoserine (thiol)-lyase
LTLPGGFAFIGPMADNTRARRLSPRRNSTQAADIPALVAEQLSHFGIDAKSAFGEKLAKVAARLYEAHDDLDDLWKVTLDTVSTLDRSDRIAYFNAQKFLSFQLAKLLDDLQNPSRRSYQSLGYSEATITSKGPYAVFDNVAAIFSANPVIARTATYIYACAEWIQDAFEGKELLLEIYSRLLNPTSIALANQIVELEAGPYARDYFAWNFNSGMAAIDSTLSHVLGRDDILITSRNIYGGAYQLIHDWYGRSANLEIAVEWFDGYGAEDFLGAWQRVQQKYRDRLAAGRRVYVWLESPCNPHGDVLDVPAICREAHRLGSRVMIDATIATPFLFRPLQRSDAAERPDFVIHSYTKDLSGTGSVLGGVVIARNQDMFLPKGDPGWEQTMFWNVYYVMGMRSLDVRMIEKCINTQILMKFLAAHPQIRVHGATGRQAELRQRLMFLGLPAPLFTADMPGVPREAFQRFFDSLAPTFDHMISLGQPNTIISCPALTTHSELDEAALAEAGISSTTIRYAIGDEDPKDLIAHFIAAAKLTLGEEFAGKFMSPAQIDALVRDCYLDTHKKYIESRPNFSL